ncbi:COBW domain-containing protein 1 [Perkinsus olseni]|uniref:COBW domain-containing protein 1 n=1 Tax=Perkinsus olseni TaxID=32597 RepID=A0A7J6LAR9_PEROL|nr:COBW domain-containing protein 1 [Perkinsus olseni]KAF4656324.1 COBW domain-containing protein 1 [Perkinsus olseni]
MPADFSLPTVPVTVVSGFLGSGKTTLIQNLLKSGRKIAVVQNEMGYESMGIESPVLTDGDGNVIGDILLELPGGCLCCTIRDDLVTGLEAMLKKRNFDQIVIETSGVADPVKMIEILWLDSELETPLRLDSTVTVVDSKNIASVLHGKGRTLAEGGSSREAVRQICCADLVLLNKCDICEGGEIEVAKGVVSATNPDATVELTEFSGQGDLERITTMVLDRQAYSGNTTARSFELNAADLPPADTHVHVDHVVVYSNTRPRKAALERWLGAVLWGREEGNEVYRLKGLVETSDEGWCAIQGVGEIFEVVELSIPVDPQTQSKILFVGTGPLDRDALQMGLDGCDVEDVEDDDV